MKNKKAFTLIELIIVLSIITILSLMIVPKIFNVIENAENIKLETNCKIIERDYQLFLTTKSIDHSELTLIQFFIQNFPKLTSELSITYDGNVFKCMYKTNTNDEVPFL